MVVACCISYRLKHTSDSSTISVFNMSDVWVLPITRKYHHSPKSMYISIYMQKVSTPLQPNSKFPSFNTTKIHETEKWGNSLILQSNIPRSIRDPGIRQERHRDVATGTFFHHSSTINRGLNVHDSRRRQTKNAIWSLSLRTSTYLYRAPSTVRIPGRHKPH